MTAYTPPQHYPEVVSSPCSACPWRRESIQGYLGPYTAKEWIQIAHGESAIACHKTVKVSDSWDGAMQCAGAAAFRANVCKNPRHPEIVCGPRREDVFSNNQEFVEYHTFGEQTWSREDMWR